jgi:hypothetical protein
MAEEKAKIEREIKYMNGGEGPDALYPGAKKMSESGGEIISYVKGQTEPFAGEGNNPWVSGKGGGGGEKSGGGGGCSIL